MLQLVSTTDMSSSAESEVLQLQVYCRASMSLSFPDPEAEQVFASRFASTMSGVGWKMNVVRA